MGKGGSPIASLSQLQLTGRPSELSSSSWDLTAGVIRNSRPVGQPPGQITEPSPLGLDSQPGRGPTARWCLSVPLKYAQEVELQALKTKEEPTAAAT